MAALWFHRAGQDQDLPSPEKFNKGFQGPKHHAYSDLPLWGWEAVLLWLADVLATSV